MDKTSEETPAKIGRPSKLDGIDLGVVEILSESGLTDSQMARVFGIAESTFNDWKNRNKDFLDTIKEGKSHADSQVKASLFQRACGYSHPDTHITTIKGAIVKTELTKHYAPDTAAAFIWLKNRDPLNWKDKHEVVGDMSFKLPKGFEIVFVKPKPDAEKQD